MKITLYVAWTVRERNYMYASLYYPPLDYKYLDSEFGVSAILIFLQCASRIT